MSPAAVLLLVSTVAIAGNPEPPGVGAASPSGPAPATQCRAEPISAPAASPHFQFWWRHRTGTTAVPFQLHIARDGSVADARILPGEYHHDFAVETLKAIRKWKYRPLECGPPEGIWVRSKMIFQAPEETSDNSSKPKPLRGSA